MIRGSALWVGIGILVALGCLTIGNGGLISVTSASEGALEWESIPDPGIVWVKYREQLDTETGKVRQRLEVFMEDAVPDSEYLVVIKGRELRVQTDDKGQARRVADRRIRVPEGHRRPPQERRIDTGDRCEVHHGAEVVAGVFVQL